MNFSPRTSDLLSVLAGTMTEAEVAQKHGVSEAEVREWRKLYADGLRGSQRFDRRPLRWLAIGAALVGTVAVAQSLVSFQPNSPANAAEVNGNFSALRTWLERKVGAVGGNQVVTDGGVALVGTNALSVPNANLNFGSTTRQMVNLWSTEYGLGVQNSTLYQRTGGHFGWYRGGAHDEGSLNAGGGTVAMLLDSSSNLGVAGNITAGGQLQGGSIRNRACAWRSTGQGVGADNVVHAVTCLGGEYMAGWQCRASDRLDGDCYAYCCLP